MERRGGNGVASGTEVLPIKRTTVSEDDNGVGFTTESIAVRAIRTRIARMFDTITSTEPETRGLTACTAVVAFGGRSAQSLFAASKLHVWTCLRGAPSFPLIRV